MSRWWDKDCWWALALVGVLTLPLVAAAALRLTWEDNSQVEAIYYVLRQRVPNDKDFRLVATLPANSTGWVDTRTQGNQTYCYMVVAAKNEERGFSNVACWHEGRGGNFNATLRIRWGSDSGQLNLDVGE